VDEKTGIQRAVDMAGGQTALLRLMIGAGDALVNPSKISIYLKQGYASSRRARVIAKVTGVPLTDLLRSEPKLYKGKPVDAKRSQRDRGRRERERSAAE
jgi:hypothetical protein